MLDFVVSADEFGKPVNADLKLGLATAPVLYAAEKHPGMWALVDRKFSREGDVEQVSLSFSIPGKQEVLIHFTGTALGS